MFTQISIDTFISCSHKIYIHTLKKLTTCSSKKLDIQKNNFLFFSHFSHHSLYVKRAFTSLASLLLKK